MLRLEDLEVYKVSVELGDLIWKIVERWDYFSKDTLGKQLTRAADSIAFNISEGYGRYHFAENRNFCYYSRGSAFETKTAINKAHIRKLISEEEYNLLSNRLDFYFRLINSYIKSIGSKPLMT
jgi:four helix bundle protein